MADDISISLLGPEHIKQAARLHVAELGYSFNSQLGAEHLTRVYQAMLRLPDSYVGAAFLGDRPVGIVSGTVNAREAKRNILRLLGWRGWAGVLRSLLLKPSLLGILLHESRLSVRIEKDGCPVEACLTALLTSSLHRRKGVATQLVRVLEEFFLSRGISHYWLDTPSRNVAARSFYERSGFVEESQANETVVFLKQIYVR